MPPLAATHPRTLDYNTSVRSAPGGYGGPLTTNITIENGVLVTHINDPNMNPLGASGFLFANNNHLAVISYNSVCGPAAPVTPNCNASEFTSSMNTITHNIAV